MIWFVPGFLVHTVLWGQGCGGGCLAVGIFGVGSCSFSESWCLDQPHVGRVVFLCPQPTLKAALEEAGTCCCHNPVPGPGQDHLGGMAARCGCQGDPHHLPLTTALPRASWSWMQSRLHNSWSRCYSFQVLPLSSLMRTVDDDELLALPLQLIFKLQYVPVPPKGRRLPGAAHGWDVPLGSREAAKPNPGMFSLSKETRQATKASVLLTVDLWLLIPDSVG